MRIDATDNDSSATSVTEYAVEYNDYWSNGKRVIVGPDAEDFVRTRVERLNADSPTANAVVVTRVITTVTTTWRQT